MWIGWAHWPCMWPRSPEADIQITCCPRKSKAVSPKWAGLRSNWRTSAQEVLLTRDPDKAARIREQDDEMDELHRQLFTVLMDRAWKEGVPAAVDVALLGRFYERFADHAVEIGRRVVFQTTGTLPPEQEVGTY